MNMCRNKILILFLFVSLFISAAERIETYRVMSYNVENLFDCEKDSIADDEEFTPMGNKHWTQDRYEKKIADIAKVIATIGDTEFPALVGLCEIENDKVLSDLVKNASLNKQHYLFVHKDSPDERGLDVALLYQKDKFKLLSKTFIPIYFVTDSTKRTRDILFAKGIIPSGDTLCVFVNHFPSRLGGELKSENYRLFVASVLRKKVDSIFHSNPHAQILIMGDFNDYPNNKSISEVLRAKKTDENITQNELYNLFYVIHEKGEIGTYKMGRQWGVLDQMIVSGNLLMTENDFYTTTDDAHIFSPDFLLETEKKSGEKRPFRTYKGLKYAGGTSDHLPIYVDFTIKENRK
jgi:predicted extracellular nuclease